MSRVCLVTGATSGIGLVTAQGLATAGATVLGVGRSADRCREAERRVAEESGNSDVHFFCHDLSSMTEVRALAESVRERHRTLDVLVNNVGAMFSRRQETAEGLEATFALNHLSPFLLTHLLEEPLRSAAPSRVVNLSSEAHRGVTLDFDDLQASSEYSHLGWHEYQRSKLANLLFTYEHHRRNVTEGVTTNAVHPGVVATGFTRKAGLDPLRRLLVRLRSISVSAGADTVLYLALSDEVEGRSGGYWIKRGLEESSEASREEATAERLWKVSLDLSRPR